MIPLDNIKPFCLLYPVCISTAYLGNMQNYQLQEERAMKEENLLFDGFEQTKQQLFEEFPYR